MIAANRRKESWEPKKIIFTDDIRVCFSRYNLKLRRTRLVKKSLNLLFV